MGNLSPARRRTADRALNNRPRDPPERQGIPPAHDLGNRVLGEHYADRPGYPGRGPVYQLDWHRTADDRAVEALLACVREPCTAQQLAYGLGWTLNRTVDALQRLEASVANTGQILTRLGHYSYTLGPRPGLLDDREIARCLRHNREPLNLTAAAVLHRALTRSREDRARDALSSPAEHGGHTTARRGGAAGGRPRRPTTNAPGRSDGPGTPGPPASR